MTQEEIKLSFEAEIQEILKNIKLNLVKNIYRDLDGISLSLRKTLEEIFFQNNKLPDEIEYVEFSLLRTSILHNNFSYMTRIYQKDNLKEPIFSRKISFPFIWKEIETLKEEMMYRRKKYIGAIKIEHVDSYIQKNLLFFHDFVGMVLFEGLSNIKNQREWEILFQDKEPKILFGEYDKIPLEIVFGGN